MEKQVIPQPIDVTVSHLVYGLLLAGLLHPIFPILALLLGYYKSKEVVNTYLYSHYQWQLQTLWMFIVGLVLVQLMKLIYLGILANLCLKVWLCYRIYQGWVLLFAGKDKPLTKPNYVK